MTRPLGKTAPTPGRHDRLLARLTKGAIRKAVEIGKLTATQDQIQPRRAEISKSHEVRR
jgi:hypothetical protein